MYFQHTPIVGQFLLIWQEMDMYFHHTPIVGPFLIIRPFSATTHIVVTNLAGNGHVFPPHTSFYLIIGHNYTHIVGVRN